MGRNAPAQEKLVLQNRDTTQNDLQTEDDKDASREKAWVVGDFVLKKLPTSTNRIDFQQAVRN
jgi:hypothetical protein